MLIQHGLELLFGHFGQNQPACHGVGKEGGLVTHDDVKNGEHAHTAQCEQECADKGGEVCKQDDGANRTTKGRGVCPTLSNGDGAFKTNQDAEKTADHQRSVPRAKPLHKGRASNPNESSPPTGQPARLPARAQAMAYARAGHAGKASVCSWQCCGARQCHRVFRILAVVLCRARRCHVPVRRPLCPRYYRAHHAKTRQRPGVHCRRECDGFRPVQRQVKSWVLPVLLDRRRR